MLACECVEHVLGGHDVGAHVTRGLGDRTAHARHPGQVDHDVGPFASRETLRGAGGRKVDHVELEALVPQRTLDVGDLQPRVVVVVERVDAVHAITGREQMFDDVRADETGAPGHEGSGERVAHAGLAFGLRCEPRPVSACLKMSPE